MMQKIGMAEFNLGAYLAGIYFIKYLAGKTWWSVKWGSNNLFALNSKARRMNLLPGFLCRNTKFASANGQWQWTADNCPGWSP